MSAGAARPPTHAPAPPATGAELISHFGHALRTPLNSILGFAQILTLDRAHPLSAWQRERVDQIQAAGWQLLQMIDDMVHLSRLESDPELVTTAAIPLEPLIRESVALQGDQAARIELAADARLHGTVTADAARLKQALASVLGAALRCGRRGAIQVGVDSRADGGVAIRIRDSAQSLSAEQLERTFLPLDHLPAQHAAGQGVQIALALAQRLIVQMGGRLQVRRDPVCGSELQVLLR